MVLPMYSIQTATPADLDALVALERHAFTTDHLSRRQYRRHLGSPTAIVLVATDAGEFVGNAVVFLRARSNLARLYSIAVSHHARGRGLGEVLLAAAENAAPRKN